jgi:hypothetical protein
VQITPSFRPTASDWYITNPLMPLDCGGPRIGAWKPSVPVISRVREARVCGAPVLATVAIEEDAHVGMRHLRCVSASVSRRTHHQ